MFYSFLKKPHKVGTKHIVQGKRALLRSFPAFDDLFRLMSKHIIVKHAQKHPIPILVNEELIEDAKDEL